MDDKKHNCKMSIGICGRLTFGSGKLDFYGYWEHPCEECARAWKKENPNDAVWPPFEKEKEGLKFYN